MADGAVGNPQRGADLFVELCEHCHTVEAGEPHPYGPNLSGYISSTSSQVTNSLYEPHTESGAKEQDPYRTTSTLPQIVLQAKTVVLGNR